MNQSMFRIIFWAWIVIIYALALIPNANPPKFEIGNKYEIRFDYILLAIGVKKYLEQPVLPRLVHEMSTFGNFPGGEIASIHCSAVSR